MLDSGIAHEDLYRVYFFRFYVFPLQLNGFNSAKPFLYSTSCKCARVACNFKPKARNSQSWIHNTSLHQMQNPILCVSVVPESVSKSFNLWPPLISFSYPVRCCSPVGMQSFASHLLSFSALDDPCKDSVHLGRPILRRFDSSGGSIGEEWNGICSRAVGDRQCVWFGCLMSWAWYSI